MEQQTIIEYYGLSTFSIEYDDTTFLVDPWFEAEWSGGSPEDFEDIDYILVTHGAHDHLGSAYPIAARTGAVVITEPSVADHLESKGLPEEQVKSMVWGNSFTVEGVTIRALETRHISYFESAEGPVSGIALGFHFDFGSTSLYYLGDTAIFGDLELFGELYEPDVAMLPVGNAPGAFAPLPPDEAALAVDMLDPNVAIPVHYIPGSGDPLMFRNQVDEICDLSADTAVRELEIGQRFDLSIHSRNSSP